MGGWIERRPSGESPKPSSRLFPVSRVAAMIASANFTPERRFGATDEELALVQAKNPKLAEMLKLASQVCTDAEGNRGMYKLIENAVHEGAMFVYRATREHAEDQIPTFEDNEARELFDQEFDTMNDLASAREINPNDLVTLAKVRLRQLAEEPNGDSELIEELFTQRFNDQLSFVGALLTLSSLRKLWQRREREKEETEQQKRFDDEIATWVDPDIADLETRIFPAIQSAQPDQLPEDLSEIDFDEELRKFFGPGGQQEAA